ncbi:MAG TPA: DUF3499 family protein [Microbacteriaceae bacterium]|nr:DUF3499 family protein [Microbacteriaceae bacterium]
MTERVCSRVSCSELAVATLTYDYAEQLAVLGPLARTAEPHSYDLCPRHAERTSTPQGWQLVRYAYLQSNAGFAAPAGSAGLGGLR